jgi:hypothetical protein
VSRTVDGPVADGRFKDIIEFPYASRQGSPLQSSPEGAAKARQYCSELNASESLWGTADTVDVWLCLEYRPVWKPKAMADNALAAPIRSWLAESIAAVEASGLKVRPQFIRQPEVDRDDTRLLLTVNGAVTQFSGRGYDYLEDLDLARIIQGGLADGPGTEPDGPIYLVCTNGQRDQCCARFGLPAYNALKERVGERVWQATHLGGHRFAPNVLVLPNACLYGRVQAEGVDEFLDFTERDLVDFDRLRGRTGYPAIVQAGEGALARQNVRLLHVDGDDSAAVITFADDAARHSVSMARAGRAELVSKSCGDGARAEVYPFVVSESGMD